MIKKFIVVATMLLSPIAFGHGNQSHSKVGNGNNINNCNPTLVCKTCNTCKKKPKVITKYKTRTVVKEKIVKEEMDRNSLSLIAVANPTGLTVSEAGGKHKAKTDYEFDIGLMFQHDFDDIRGTVGVTVQGNLFLGAGVRF